jgi:hypothetical protein
VIGRIVQSLTKNEWRSPDRLEVLTRSPIAPNPIAGLKLLKRPGAFHQSPLVDHAQREASPK